MAFETYENVINKHCYVHKAGCGHLRQHGGEHRYEQGKYRSFATFAEAYEYASKTGLPFRVCKTCERKGGMQ